MTLEEYIRNFPDRAMVDAVCVKLRKRRRIQEHEWERMFKSLECRQLARAVWIAGYHIAPDSSGIN